MGKHLAAKKAVQKARYWECMYVEYAVGCVEGFIERRPLGCVEGRDDGLELGGLADGFEVGRIVEPVNNVKVLP